MSQRLQHLLVFCLILLSAVLLFRRPLLDSTYAIPWDLRGHHLPLATALADSIQEGELPLWDPFTYCGRPLLANPQTAALYPPMLAAALFGREGMLDRLEWLVALHTAAAGWFVWLLGLRMRLPPGAAAAAALMFAVGGFAASQPQHLSSIGGMACLAAAWWAVTHAERRSIVLLAAALAASFLLGFPSFTVMIAISAFLFAVAWHGTWKALRMTLAGSLLAAGIAAAQLWPSLELVKQSVGKYRWEWIVGHADLPPSALASLLVPDFHGVFDLRTFAGKADPTFLYLFSSVTGLALALAGLVAWREPKVRKLGALLPLFALIMFGSYTAVGAAFHKALPEGVRGTFYPYLFSAPFLLTLALLAGKGVSKWISSSRWQWAAAVAIATECVVVSGRLPLLAQPLQQEPVMTATTVDGSAEQWRVLHKAAGEGRLDTMTDALPLMTGAPITGIRAANGYDPLALERLIQLRLTAAEGKRWGAYYPIENPQSPAVTAMAIQAISTRKQEDAKKLQDAGFLPAGSFGPRTIWKNPAPAALYRLVYTTHSASSMAESKALLPKLDLRTEAVVEGLTPAPSQGTGKVSLQARTRNRIEFNVETSSPATLVVSESWYPGWEATVDGKKVQTAPANIAFQAVPIDSAGEHKVVLRFAPGSIWLGFPVTFAALGLCALLWRAKPLTIEK